MKTVSGGLNTHLGSETTTLATCLKLILNRNQPRIVAITNANPGVVTTRWAHGFETGTVVRFKNVRGMTGLNRTEFVVTVIDDFSFSIGVDTSAFDAYTHKGVAQEVEGYTAHPQDIVFDNVTYQSETGYLPESTKQGSDMAVDSVELRGILTNAAKNEIASMLIEGISDEAVLSGRYYDAKFEYFKVNYEDLAQGRMAVISGTVGEITLHRGMYESELSGKTSRLQETLQEVYTANCRADLGDDLDGSEPEHELQQGFGCKVRLDPPPWQAEVAYTVRPAGDAGLGSVVKPSVYIGVHFKATVAGTSGTTEPVWNPTIGATTADGTVTWEAIEALTKQGIVHAVTDRRRFTDNDRSEAPIEGIGGAATLFPITAVNTGAKRFTIAGEFEEHFPVSARFVVVNSPANDGQYTVVSATNSSGNTLIVVSETVPSGAAGGAIIGRLPSLVGFFTFGRVTFLTGRNKGISRETKNFASTTVDGETFTGPGTFEMFEAFPFEIAIGDQYEAHAGCDKSLNMCVTRFDNIHNRRAEDNIPGNDSMLLYPDAN